MEPLFIAVFLLALAGDDAGSFGTFTDPHPVPQEVCEYAIGSPTIQARVAAFVKEQTGEDVVVTGLCKLAGE